MAIIDRVRGRTEAVERPAWSASWTTRAQTRWLRTSKEKKKATQGQNMTCPNDPRDIRCKPRKSRGRRT